MPSGRGSWEGVHEVLGEELVDDGVVGRVLELLGEAQDDILVGS